MKTLTKVAIGLYTAVGVGFVVHDEVVRSKTNEGRRNGVKAADGSIIAPPGQPEIPFNPTELLQIPFWLPMLALLPFVGVKK